MSKDKDTNMKTNKEEVKKNISKKVPPATKADHNKYNTQPVSTDKSLPMVVDQKGINLDPAVKASWQPIKFGLIISAISVLFFGVWASLAPLNSAAIAVGSVVLDSNRKTIQHLEGGIIADILVKEGDKVEKGQPLVQLNNSNAKANQELLLGQYITAKATEHRLLSERDDLEFIEFDQDLIASTDDLKIKKIIDSQKRIFETRRNDIKGRISVVKQRIKQLKDEISGLISQRDATFRRLKISKKELVDMEPLVKKGVIIKTKFLELQKQAAELEGDLGQYKSSIARTKQKITEADMEILNLRNDYINEVVSELSETQQTIADLEEKLRATSDVLTRTTISAPQSGIITDVQFHTIGGVIRQGEKIMDIIPQDDKMIVKANVLPQDIDVVRIGLKSQVRLSALSARFAPRLSGVVTYVSADSIKDEKSGMTFYTVNIEIDEDSIKKLKDEEVELYPGMPAEVYIVTGERTLVEYLISPIFDSFNRSFKEQ